MLAAPAVSGLQQGVVAHLLPLSGGQQVGVVELATASVVDRNVVVVEVVGEPDQGELDAFPMRRIS